MIADPNIVKCKTCVGEPGGACDDGDNAESEPCIMGEKSCLYGKTSSMLDKGTRFLIASLPRNLKIYLFVVAVQVVWEIFLFMLAILERVPFFCSFLNLHLSLVAPYLLKIS